MINEESELHLRWWSFLFSRIGKASTSDSVYTYLFISPLRFEKQKKHPPPVLYISIPTTGE